MANYDVTRIAGNIGALNALNSLNQINQQLATHQSRLSSGKRINSAADDPAGLTIATKMNAQDQGLQTAASNIGDAQNLLSVAESGLSGINDILVQMRNKAQQGASDTLGTEERKALVQQMSAYAQQIDDAVTQTQWNGNKLIDGTFGASGKAMTFQTGANVGDITTLQGLENMSASGGLGLSTKAASTPAAYVDNSSALVWANIGGKLGINSASAGNLKSGNYTVSVGYSADGLASTVKLLDTQGNTIDSQAVDLKTADLTVNFAVNGTGLGVNIKDLANATAANGGTSAASTTFTAGLSYSATGTGSYSLTGLASDGSSNAATFSSYLSVIDTAMSKISSQMSMIGAMEGRLNYKSDQVANSQINVEGAYNRIMNADMASEQVQSSKLQILQQTATAMLAQANTAPQFILSLFK
jgi:flagellin